jgi:hypothetical protein
LPSSTRGFVALFRPHEIRYDDTRTIRVGDQTIRSSTRATMTSARAGDTLRVS